MVVGLQGRGKTTLLSVLRDPTAPLPENISTVGVNVADWVVKAPPETVKRFKGVVSRVSNPTWVERDMGERWRCGER